MANHHRAFKRQITTHSQTPTELSVPTPTISPMGHSSLTDIQLKILEHVHGRPEQTSELSDLETSLGTDRELLNIVEDLADSRFLRRALRGDGVYHLTPSGQTEIDALLKRREDRSHRRTQCRDALLGWLDKTTEPDPGTRVSLEKFTGGVDGIAFTEKEVDLAADYLVAEGLIETVGDSWGRNHLLAYITGAGQERLDEGNGAAGITELSLAPSVVQQITITGDGNIVTSAAGSHNEVQANINDFDLVKAQSHSEAIREALPALEELKNEIVPLLDQIQTDDRSLAQKATFALYQLLTGTGTGALGSALAFRWPRPLESPDAEMESKYQLALEEARRGHDSQLAQLENLRSRGTWTVAAGALALSVIGVDKNDADPWFYLWSIVAFSASPPSSSALSSSRGPGRCGPPSSPISSSSGSSSTRPRSMTRPVT